MPIVQQLSRPVRHLFFDLGGVVLTNGWDRHCRERVAADFGLDYDQFNARHYDVVAAFETGDMRINAYLDKTVFYKERDFSRDVFIDAMKGASARFDSSFTVLDQLKTADTHGLYSLNNESFDLNLYRIDHFGLRHYFDYFFSSCFLGAKKPDPLIFQRVLYITQFRAEECLFVDDRVGNAEAAAAQGFQAIHLAEVEKLGEELADFL